MSKRKPTSSHPTWCSWQTWGRPVVGVALVKVFVSAYLTTAAQRWKCWRGQCWMTGVEDESSGVGVVVKVGSQRARPGIKMWQLNKRAQVKRSFQSDPSVWRWSWLCPTPHQQLLLLSLFLLLSKAEPERSTTALAFVFDCYVCSSGCMCQFTYERNVEKQQI